MHRVLLEVERKFAGFAVPHLTACAGKPAFRHLEYIGRQSFTDTYYDHSGRLASAGVWLRRRQLSGKPPTWEAKYKQGGTFNNSMFEELTDVVRIAALVADLTGQQGGCVDNFGLEALASLSTDRNTWVADHCFKIVLDLSDFGHEVGEVEQERTVALPCPSESTFDIAAYKRQVTEDMDREIREFMDRYHWAFRSELPKGKLTAYFERQRELRDTPSA